MREMIPVPPRGAAPGVRDVTAKTMTMPLLPRDATFLRKAGLDLGTHEPEGEGQGEGEGTSVLHHHEHLPTRL